MDGIQEYTLPNGIRIVHRQVTHTAISHMGLMLDMGSRDEKPHQQGLAHFWEHMAFKGTHKRKSFLHCTPHKKTEFLFAWKNSRPIN